MAGDGSRRDGKILNLLHVGDFLKYVLKKPLNLPACKKNTFFFPVMCL